MAGHEPFRAIYLFMPPEATECSDFTTISLLGHAAKVLIRVLTKRIEAKANAINHIGKNQFGFRKGKGTRDAVATSRVLYIHLYSP